MKYLIFSDVHGSELATKKMIDIFKEEKCEKMIILGDVLYHGPRNDLPKGYNPKGVIALLNNYAKDIICVRGNCEAQVDQMVLEFPCLSEYTLIIDEGVTLFAAHGHQYDIENLPSYVKRDIFLYGHTHLWEIEKDEQTIRCNPGSVSIPKGGNEATYAIYEKGKLGIYNLDKELLKAIEV